MVHVVYRTAGRFAKTSKADNGDVGLINARVAVNDRFSFGGMFAHVGTTNVRMVMARKITNSIMYMALMLNIMLVNSVLMASG